MVADILTSAVLDALAALLPALASNNDGPRIETIALGLRQLGLRLSAEQQARLLAYLKVLDKWNRVYSLTAIRDAEQAVSLHLLDSLAALPPIEALRPQRLLDVGSGGGMPGLLFAIARPDWQLTLIDSNQKKTAFLRQAVVELKLNNVEVVTGRVEALAGRQFDVITSRAFAELVDFVTLAGHLLAEQGRFAALKGVYPQAEIDRLPANWRVQAVHPLKVPGVDAERHLVEIAPA